MTKLTVVVAKDKKYFQIGSLEKGLKILKLLANHGELTVTQVAKLMGANRSWSHRFLATLKEAGWVEKNENGRYQLTLYIFELGSVVANRLEVRQVARRFMQNLWSISRETVNLGCWDGKAIIHIDKIESLEILRMDTPLGSSAPAYCTGLGKSILSHLPANELNAYFDNTLLERHGPNTITDKTKLMKELDIIRRRGVAVDNEELSLALRCVAAPVFDSQRFPRYALSIAGPSMRLTLKRIKELQPIIKEQSAMLSAILAHA
jgi:IclR family transcriptional regulator, KDG regulon repressor